MLFKLSCTGIASFVTGLAVIAVGMMLGTPADAGEIYSWKTENGEAAFADDPKKVPARYRDQVSLRDAKGLDDYERFTAGVGAPEASYPDQLAARLDHLRAMNMETRAAQPNQGGNGSGIVSVRVADMDIQLAGGPADVPVIIEEVRVIRDGQIATHHDTVVRQGNRTLAIVRGREAGEIDGASNITNEEDLLGGGFYR
jgi:hypothetical protein